MTTFSVIVPVYNGVNYVSETVASIVKFTANQDCEIIVINDGSKDGTLNILEEFKDKIILISQDNIGEARTVNRGIGLAKGKFGLVVSADDPLISEEIFHEALKIFKENPDCVAVYPDWQIIDSRNEVVMTKKCPDYSFKELLGNFHCIPGPGTIFSIEKARSIGGREAEYRFVSDYDFWLRLALTGQFKRIPKVLAQWRTHDASTSIGNRGIDMALERVAVIDSFLRKYPQERSLELQARACSLYHAAMLAFFDPEIPGKKWMVKALWIKKGWITSSRIKVVAYLLLLPFSKYALKIFPRISSLPR
jgi:glycosyltransferase involved in cell wall biosynthesis